MIINLKKQKIDNNMELFIKNEKRRLESLKKSQKFFLIRIIKEKKKYWFKLNEMYVVRKYPYKTTKSGTITYCQCEECKKERKGKKLYDMYEVVMAKEPIETKINDIITLTKIDALIPIEVCKILKVFE